MTQSPTRFELAAEPRDELYDRLLAFLCRHAATFTVVPIAATLDDLSVQGVLHQLLPYLIESKRLREWPGTRLLLGQEELVNTYRVEPGSIAVMRRNARGLYEWHGPELPDDPCFYRRDGSVLLSSTPIESMAQLELTDTELGDARSVLGTLLLRQSAH